MHHHHPHATRRTRSHITHTFCGHHDQRINRTSPSNRRRKKKHFFLEHPQEKYCEKMCAPKFPTANRLQAIRMIRMSRRYISLKKCQMKWLSPCDFCMKSCRRHLFRNTQSSENPMRCVRFISDFNLDWYGYRYK